MATLAAALSPVEVQVDSNLQSAIAQMTPGEFTKFQENRHRALVLYATTIAATVVVVWEHIVLFRAELRTWQALRRGKVMPARLAIIAVRYIALCTVGVTMSFFFGRPINCKTAIVTMYSLYTLLVAVASSVFLMRLHIIYAAHAWIMAAYYALFAANIAAWVVIDLGFEAYEIPRDLQWKHAGKCMPRRVPWYTALGWGANFVFDAVTLVGTWWRLRWVQRQKGSGRELFNRTHRFIWLSNVFYFSIACIFNIGALVTELLVSSPIYSHLPSPVAFAAHTIIACRLLLTGKDWGVLDPESDVEENGRVANETYALGAHGRRGAVPSGRAVPYTVDQFVTVQETPAHVGQQDQEQGQQQEHQHQEKANLTASSPGRAQGPTCVVRRRSVSGAGVRLRQEYERGGQTTPSAKTETETETLADSVSLSRGLTSVAASSAAVSPLSAAARAGGSMSGFSELAWLEGVCAPGPPPSQQTQPTQMQGHGHWSWRPRGGEGGTSQESVSKAGTEGHGSEAATHGLSSTGHAEEGEAEAEAEVDPAVLHAYPHLSGAYRQLLGRGSADANGGGGGSASGSMQLERTSTFGRRSAGGPVS